MKNQKVNSKSNRQTNIKQPLIPDNIKSVSKNTNSTVSSFFACVYSIILTLGVIGCYTSAFNIKASLIVCSVTTLIFVTVVGLICALVKHKSKLFVSLSVILIAFIFTVLFSLSYIVEQARYFINCILKIYSAYLPVPAPVKPAELPQIDATAFLVVVAFIVSFIITVSLVRARRILPVLIITVALLVPCFILVNTLPALPAIISVVAILFSLYITTFLRRRNVKINGVASPIISVIMVITAIAVCIANPVDTYERSKWQEELLYELENLTGIEGNQRISDNDLKAKKYKKVGNSFEKTKFLNEIGPLELSDKKAMKIYTEKGGTVYLRGISYGDYDLNQWSLPHENRINEVPDEINSFTQTKTGNWNINKINIITERIEPVMYSTYYTDEIPEDFTVLGDVCISNDEKETSYSYNYQVDDGSGLYTVLSTNTYTNFVYENYLYLPELTRDSILRIAEEEGFELGYDAESMAKKVKNYVSEIGYYSLDTEQIPENKDFPIWFLTEAKSGYCVHYATTAAVMLRAFGVPARFVTGYVVNAKSGEWTTVTEKNAHAWVEYFDFDRGWIMLEATPSSFEIYENNEDNTTSTQATTQKPTAPSTKPTNPQSNNRNNKIKFSADMLLWLIPVAVVMAIGSIPLRCELIKRKRKREFTQGRNKSKAICIYRYIREISVHSTNIVPELIDEIALKAKFSNHSIEDKEVEILMKYAKESREELYRNSGKLKTLYLKFIKVI